MALKGNLRDFSIIQILNLVNLAKKTGTLVVEGSGETSHIAFRDGKLTYARCGSEDNSLPAILHRNRKISRNQARILKEKAVNMSDKQLGLMLVNAGYVPQNDILYSLQDYYISIIRRFFAWVEGSFQFRPDILAPADKIPVKIDLENLIIEGSRQTREWEQLQEEIPSLDVAVKFINHQKESLKNLNLSVEEWRVVKSIDPQNTLRDIARAAKMNELEIRRVVYALVQAGVVEITRPRGKKISLSSALPNTSKEEQKTLVNRLIGRIRTL